MAISASLESNSSQNLCGSGIWLRPRRDLTEYALQLGFVDGIADNSWCVNFKSLSMNLFLGGECKASIIPAPCDPIGISWANDPPKWHQDDSSENFWTRNIRISDLPKNKLKKTIIFFWLSFETPRSFYTYCNNQKYNNELLEIKYALIWIPLGSNIGPYAKWCQIRKTSILKSKLGHYMLSVRFWRQSLSNPKLNLAHNSSKRYCWTVCIFFRKLCSNT